MKQTVSGRGNTLDLGSEPMVTGPGRFLRRKGKNISAKGKQPQNLRAHKRWGEEGKGLVVGDGRGASGEKEGSGIILAYSLGILRRTLGERYYDFHRAS